MKVSHSIKFIFTEKEIEHVRATLEMLQNIDERDYDELCNQVEDELNYDIYEIIGYLGDLLDFMEKHVDLQDD